MSAAAIARPAPPPPIRHDPRLPQPPVSAFAEEDPFFVPSPSPPPSEARSASSVTSHQAPPSSSSSSVSSSSSSVSLRDRPSSRISGPSAPNAPAANTRLPRAPPSPRPRPASRQRPRPRSRSRSRSRPACPVRRVPVRTPVPAPPKSSCSSTTTASSSSFSSSSSSSPSSAPAVKRPTIPACPSASLPPPSDPFSIADARNTALAQRSRRSSRGSTLAPPPDPKPRAKSGVALWEERVLELVNATRAQQGTHPLRLSPTLARVARKHNADQAFIIRGISHVGSGGGTVGERLKEGGYRYLYASENVAVGQKNPAHVHRSLMKSPGHARNILSNKVYEMGLHVGRGADGRLYWTQLFGRKR